MAKSQSEETRQAAQGEPAAGGKGQSMARTEPGGGPMAPFRGPRSLELDRPWSFRRLFDEFDRMFEHMQQQILGPQPFRLEALGGWRPRMDVQDTAREVVLTLELPGFEPDEVSIECTEDVLTIRGEHREAEEPGGYRAERSFFRQIVVPAGCDVGKTQATFRNGLLTIRLPRAPEHVRRIPIETEARAGQAQPRPEQRAA
jgi:HSP20 family protein